MSNRMFFLLIFISLCTLGYSESLKKNDVALIFNELIKKANEDIFLNEDTDNLCEEKEASKKIESVFHEDFNKIQKYVMSDTNSLEKIYENFSNLEPNQNEYFVLLKCISFAPNLKSDDINKILLISQNSESNFIYDMAMDIFRNVKNKKEVQDYLIAQYKNSSVSNEKSNLAVLLIQLGISDIDFILQDFIKLQNNHATPSIFLLAGDQTIPFLRKQINSNDKNVQSNTVMLLGLLLDYESFDKLKNLFHNSNDKNFKFEILTAMMNILPNLKETRELKRFFKEYLNEEFKKDNLKYKSLQETLQFLHDIESELIEFQKAKNYDKEKFKNEYNIMYESKGEKGDLNLISKTSSYENEDDLRKLKSQIVRGFIDNYVHDYNRLNEIIRFNKLIKSEN